MIFCIFAKTYYIQAWVGSKLIAISFGTAMDSVGKQSCFSGFPNVKLCIVCFKVIIHTRSDKANAVNYDEMLLRMQIYPRDL